MLSLLAIVSANPFSRANITTSALSVGIFVWVILLIVTNIKKRMQFGRRWVKTPRTVTIAGKELTCQNCGHNKFLKREGLLNTSLITLFNFSQWNQSCSCLVCDQCQHLHWFVAKIAANQ